MLGSYDSVCQASTCQASSLCSFEFIMPWRTEWYHLHCSLKNIHQILGNVFNRYIGDMHHDSDLSKYKAEPYFWFIIVIRCHGPESVDSISNEICMNAFQECHSRTKCLSFISCNRLCRCSVKIVSPTTLSWSRTFLFILLLTCLVWLRDYGVTGYSREAHQQTHFLCIHHSLHFIHTLHSSLSSWSTLKA